MTERLLISALNSALSGQPVRLPEGGRLLWQAFLDLSATRTMHAVGPNPISYQEIAAYAALMRLPLGRHHLKVLRAMDTVWLARTSGGDSFQPANGGSRQALTASVFDAMFS